MSFKDKTVLSAWKKSGISPLNPEIFTQRDFGPSFATSIKPLFPASFQSLLDSGPESRDTGIEDNEDNDDEDKDMVIVPSDWSPESNCGVEASNIGPSEDPGRRNNLPILAQPVTTHVSQDISLPKPSSPSVLRYCRNVRLTWVKFDSKDTKESEWVFEVLSTKSKKRT